MEISIIFNFVSKKQRFVRNLLNFLMFYGRIFMKIYDLQNPPYLQFVIYFTELPVQTENTMIPKVINGIY